MIKIDLITGFLGSGKTTFLLKYARYLMKQGLKIGILEYDYGSINVDMMLLSKLRCNQCELEMLAAACDEDCLKRRFTTKLISMAMSGYDRVIIEPSGVFDMDMFFDALRDEPLENWYEIGSVITVVNAGLSDNLDEESSYVLASQVAGAGCILLSRTQLVDGDTIEKTKLHILKATEDIKCNRFKPKYMEKSWDDLEENDYKYLMNCGYNICDYVKSFASSESGFSSVSLLEQPSNLEELKIRIKELLSNTEYGNVLRIKGFALDKGTNYQINITKDEENIVECGIGSGVIIVIGNDLNEEKIKELLLKQ